MLTRRAPPHPGPSTLGAVRRSDLQAVISVRAALRSGDARKIRERLGVSAADLARVVGVSRAAVSDWERGRRVPTAGHALAYGKALAAVERKAA